MGKVTILKQTTKNCISTIGEMAGICYGSNTADRDKNLRRGINCIYSGHGRVTEFPDVYMKLEGYSARVIREFYTHIGGAPTRLQASTRYINYKDFNVVMPKTIEKNQEAKNAFEDAISAISKALVVMEEQGVPKEDSAMLLPLGMETTIVCKMNARTLVSMVEQRSCSRAYWEFRGLIRDIEKALREYSDEWAVFCDECFQRKCEKAGYCSEEKCCGYAITKSKFDELISQFSKN